MNLDSINRRDYIKKLLLDSNNPIKGKDLACNLNVTRQVIVRDIAILRAAGVPIIATPEGYVINNSQFKNLYSKIIAVDHNSNEIENELKTIVKYGGIIKDVIVDHPLYGEIKATLMIKTFYDMERFLDKFKNDNIEPLLILTNGVHLHTVVTENKDKMDKILKELKYKGYLME